MLLCFILQTSKVSLAPRYQAVNFNILLFLTNMLQTHISTEYFIAPMRDAFSLDYLLPDPMLSHAVFRTFSYYKLLSAVVLFQLQMTAL